MQVMPVGGELMSSLTTRFRMRGVSVVAVVATRKHGPPYNQDQQAKCQAGLKKYQPHTRCLFQSSAPV